MEKQIILGLDLSFNSTGISVTYMEDNQPKIMKFYRVVFDDESNKTGKILKPQEIKNINQIVYRMPSNIHYDDIVKNSDKNTDEQIITTLRAMICSKKICSIIARLLTEWNPDKLIVCIENYIMPSFAGPNSLKSVSGLILLQGYIREWFVKCKISQPDISMYLYTPSPTQNKKSFCGDGKAEKQKMIDTFVNDYDGNKLLPIITKGKIDDVIDAFSLMIYGYKKYLNL